jgi:OOP family OmpA-OmpF porin
LTSNPDARVAIEGHTDAQGDEASNLALSESRAEAVRDYLVSQGIAADRLETAGFGESRPIASNDTAEGRAENRRIEFRLL